jgi:predicted nucleic acid-binding protein
MIILDTNVVSALMMERPDAAIAAWLDTQAPISVWTTAVTIFEIRFGLDTMEKGRRRSRREIEFENLVRNDLEHRILDFDENAAEAAAALMAARRRAGRGIDLRDAMIAGIAISQNAVLATRNVRHFESMSLTLLNPWND